MVRVNNVGAIFMDCNITTTCCTKHVDISCLYVNEYVEDGAINIIFVKPSLMTLTFSPKNLSAELHEKYSRRWLLRSLEMFLASKIFEVKKKGFRDDVLTSIFCLVIF